MHVMLLLLVIVHTVGGHTRDLNVPVSLNIHLGGYSSDEWACAFLQCTPEPMEVAEGAQDQSSTTHRISPPGSQTFACRCWLALHEDRLSVRRAGDRHVDTYIHTYICSIVTRA